jgi:RNA-directed DNA polymerase
MNLNDKGPQMPAQAGLAGEPDGESVAAPRSEEASGARQGRTDPGGGMTMELVLERTNLIAALKRVQGNRGGAGIDGMTIQELPDWLRQHWPRVRQELLEGSYRPMPVKRVSIPKPTGGTRDLGIPAVVDRLIQQALLQVMQPRIDPTFSPHSHGFRPGRSTHGAVREALGYVKSGRVVVVDVDLAKFFDRVNHDVLMARVARHVQDTRILKLIRRFLEAGVMVEGVTMSRTEGTPQGGPLSPLLANILLDDVDKALERSGSCFVRYADDMNVYVRSVRAGERVMARLRKLFSDLHLQINEDKSAVADVKTRKFLGFTIMHGKEKVWVQVSPQAAQRFKDRIREETKPTRGRSLEDVIEQLRRWMPGWRAYFAMPESSPSTFRELDSWIRRRLRAFVLRQWRWGRVMYHELLKRDVNTHWVTLVARHASSYWANSRHSAVHLAFPTRFFDKLGLPRLKT